VLLMEHHAATSSLIEYEWIKIVEEL